MAPLPRGVTGGEGVGLTVVEGEALTWAQLQADRAGAAWGRIDARAPTFSDRAGQMWIWGCGAELTLFLCVEGDLFRLVLAHVLALAGWIGTHTKER